MRREGGREGGWRMRIYAGKECKGSAIFLTSPLFPPSLSPFLYLPTCSLSGVPSSSLSSHPLYWYMPPSSLLPSRPSPGGLVLGLTLSASARDLHEVLHEELVECSFVNHLHPWGEDGGREGGGEGGKESKAGEGVIN